MALEEVKAKLENEENHHFAEFDFGGDLQGAVGLFGEELVYAQYVANARIGLQSYMRGLIKQDKSDEEIKAAALAWKPGMRARGKSVAEKIRDLLSKVDEDEARGIIEEALADQGEEEEE